MGNSRFFRVLRAAARPTPQRRLRIMYWSMSACALALLIMLRIALAGEQRLAHALTVETRAAVAVPHVIVLRVPPAPVRAVVKPNTRRATAAHEE